MIPRCLVLACVLLGVPVAAEVRPASPLTDEDRAVFALLDRLEVPDVRGKRLVLVATGGWWQSVGEEPQGERRPGFLLDEAEGEFTAFFLDLEVRTLTRTGEGTPEHERVGHEPLDLREWVAARLEALRAMSERERWESRWGARLGEAAQLAVLARACAAHGHEDLAHELCVEAGKTAKEDEDLETLVRDQIAHARMWRAIEAFGDPSIPYAELRDAFRTYVRHFPEGKHGERAKAALALLERMVAEIEERAARPRKPWAKMSVEERAEQLVFELRDQNGRQWSQPGGCSVFADPRGEASAVHRLVAIGWPAVPALIEAACDERFTRSVGFHRDFYFSHHVLRVGDCAVAALEAIAARSFWMPRSTGSSMTREQRQAAVRARIEAWWKEAGPKGEEGYLVELTREGGDNAHHAAQRLLKRFPGAAAPAILEGARKAKDPNVRATLLELVAGLEGEEARDHVRRELVEGEELITRLAAARSLFETGDPVAVAAMIEEWEKLDGDEVTFGPGVRDLLVFLARSGEAPAIEALSARRAELSVDLALELVAAFFHDGWRGGVPLEPGPRALRAMEALLVEALHDTRVRTGMSGGWGDARFTDPAIADVAAAVLAKRFPDRYAFDHRPPPGARRRQRLELLNVWLRGQGRPPVDLPDAPTVEPLPRETTDPLIAAVLEDRGRNEALEELASLGLPAQSAVLAARAKLTEERRETTGLEALSRRLAAVAREVELVSLPAEPELRKRLESRRGRAFRGKDLVDLLLHVATDLPEGVHGIEIRAERESATSGLLLAVELIRAPTLSHGGSGGGWSTREVVVVAGRATHSSSGSASASYGPSRRNWEDLAKRWDAALDGPPERTLELVARLVRQR
jgi:hypothetical protein